MEAEIALEYDETKVAEAVVQAVSPDNFETPKGLLVKTVRRGSKIKTTIVCEGKFSTFMATIDDLLHCVSIAEKTVQMIRRLV